MGICIGSSLRESLPFPVWLEWDGTGQGKD